MYRDTAAAAAAASRHSAKLGVSETRACTVCVRLFEGFCFGGVLNGDAWALIAGCARGVRGALPLRRALEGLDCAELIWPVFEERWFAFGATGRKPPPFESRHAADWACCFVGCLVSSRSERAEGDERYCVATGLSSHCRTAANYKHTD